jgi:hypothetical protein
MAAAKPAKSRKVTKKPPARRKKTTLKDLPSVKASKIVGGAGLVDL